MQGPVSVPARFLEGRRTGTEPGLFPPSPVSLGEWTGAEARPLIGDKMRTCPEERFRLPEGEKDGIIESAHLKTGIRFSERASPAGA